MDASSFRSDPHKAITFLGMSGVGKTTLASKLPADQWFNYSGDYRIGTRYLNEPILDNIKKQCMESAFVRDLLQSNSISIENKITFDNLKPVSTFLGKLGNPEAGGMNLKEFKRRQNLHRDAEISAMLDVPDFIEKGQRLYNKPHFINDAGGSLCELKRKDVLETLAAHTIILYIQASKPDENELFERAISVPKPLYYPEDFLLTSVKDYMHEQDIDYVALIDPDEFFRWVFPKLFYARIPKYEQIARDYGCTVTTDEIRNVRDEADLLDLISTALDRKG